MSNWEEDIVRIVADIAADPSPRRFDCFSLLEARNWCLDSPMTLFVESGRWCGISESG
jgi:hypothetical protein